MIHRIMSSVMQLMMLRANSLLCMSDGPSDGMSNAIPAA